jgi:predicted GTPase
MKKILILGAAGRDFHNFNVVFRDQGEFRVLGFTAAQIPGIANRRYPSELAGGLYPDGIPIFEESELENLIFKFGVDAVVFSYSDVSHQNVMHLASRAAAAGGGVAWVRKGFRAQIFVFPVELLEFVLVHVHFATQDEMIRETHFVGFRFPG